MDEKLEILQCLIRNRAFAPSHSALAKELGYKGKMGIYRLMEGKVRQDTVDRIWDLILEHYHLTDDLLYNLARSFAGVSHFYDTLVGQMNRKHPEWVEHLVLSLTADFYDYFSDRFKAETLPILKDLKTDEPEVYWGMVTLVYIRGKGIDIYKHQEDARSAAAQVLDALDNLLFEIYPEKIDAHEAAGNLKSLNRSSCLWNIVWNGITMFRHYAESEFKNEATKALRLFDLGKRSYWRLPGSSYGRLAEVWLLIEQSYGRQTNGFYLAMRLRAGNDVCSFDLADTSVLQFWSTDDGDEPILQASRGYGPERQWSFYYYGYDGEKQELHFKPHPDSGILPDLPETLQRIHLESPAGKDEKVWARILRNWDERQGETMFKQAKEMISGMIDMSDSFRIVNITMDKTTLSLFIERKGEDGAHEYRLPIEEYGFLSEINPSQHVTIVRRRQDGELYAAWTGLGYGIKLSEFSVD